MSRRYLKRMPALGCAKRARPLGQISILEVAAARGARLDGGGWRGDTLDHGGAAAADEPVVMPPSAVGASVVGCIRASLSARKLHVNLRSPLALPASNVN